MSCRVAALLLFLALFPRRTMMYVIEDASAAPEDRAVTNTSKAGLPWPNGNADDISQYLQTGKVQW